MNKKHHNSTFHVGDRVRFDMGPSKYWGVVMEDRGPLGIQGRRIFRIEIPDDPFESMSTELPEDELELIVAEDQLARIEKEKVIEYLANGGLISILQSNLAGGRNQPRVWLCFDQLGGVTHTFFADRGVVGGAIPPPQAIWNSKVSKRKRAEVLAFLETFGLTRQDAEKVIAEVGTAR